MNEAFILDGVHTPIGRYAGALAQVRAEDLAALAVREVVVGDLDAVELMLGRLERAGARRGLATMCVGVGQGTALLLERP